jgi:hypothetical protein
MGPPMRRAAQSQAFTEERSPHADAELAATIAAARYRFIDAVVALRNPAYPIAVSLAEARQFASGFLHLIESAALGDVTARDEYLASVVPGLRESGFPFDAVLDAMIGAVVALAASLEPFHHAWLADFCGDYTARLVRAWYPAEAG